ncbi:MAG: hypothetical protein KA419_05585 [Acidobacteria bacterium]|nr:hypothetical protein [Acidobacteriota bacterium]
MSFDLFLERFKAGESAQVDRTKVLPLLRERCDLPGGKYGIYHLFFPDGCSVEIVAKGLETNDFFTGCAFHIRSFSAYLFAFIFDMAEAGDMVIFNAQGRDTESNPLAILVSDLQLKELPIGAVSHPVLCTSAEHLASLLEVDFAEWSDFRDRVVGSSNPLAGS